MPNCNNINPLIIIANIANFLISLNSRPSFKIRRLKSDEIRLKSAVRNKSPIAVKTPFPIGNPSLSPRKNGICQLEKVSSKLLLSQLQILFWLEIHFLPVFQLSFCLFSDLIDFLYSKSCFLDLSNDRVRVFKSPKYNTLFVGRNFVIDFYSLSENWNHCVRFDWNYVGWLKS